MTELGLALALVPAEVRFIPDIGNKKPRGGGDRGGVQNA